MSARVGDLAAVPERDLRAEAAGWPRRACVFDEIRFPAASYARLMTDRWARRGPT